MALVLAFLSAESENRQLEDLPLADFGRLPERLLLSVRTKAINENFLNWKLRPLLFLKSWFNAFFHLKSQHQRTLRLLFEDCRLIYFHSLMKLACLTWLLVDMEFLFSCSTRREIPYLRAPMYYSLFIVLPHPPPHPMYYSLFIMLPHPPHHSWENKAI